MDQFKGKAYLFNFHVIVAMYVLPGVMTEHHTDLQNKFCSEMVNLSTTFQIAFINAFTIMQVMTSSVIIKARKRFSFSNM